MTRGTTSGLGIPHEMLLIVCQHTLFAVSGVPVYPYCSWVREAAPECIRANLFISLHQPDTLCKTPLPYLFPSLPSFIAIIILNFLRQKQATK